MNMKLLAFITPLYVYHGSSSQKTFWEETFTPVNMKNCGCSNVRKHRVIKKGWKYITLGISLNFGSLEEMKTTSSELRDYLGRPGKGLINSQGLNIIGMSKKKGKVRHY